MWIYVDPANRVLGANDSDMSGNTGWVHADCDVPENLFDERGIPMYRLSGGEIIPITAEEMDAAYVEHKTVPTQLDRIEAQALYTALMTDTLIEEV